MAYDKVVDSARLDGALTATADAIRGKTGSADGIQWDADTGFAAAIAAIAGGSSSGVAVESGTFIPSADVSDFTVDVPQVVRDNCIFVTCAGDLEDTAELVTSGSACAAIIAMIDDRMYLSDVNDIARYATLRRLVGDSPVTGTTANRYTMGTYNSENKILIGGSVATRPFRAGVRYYYNIYYTEEADT